MARTAGIDMLERLNDGRAEIAPPRFVIETREEVSLALEELMGTLLAGAHSPTSGGCGRVDVCDYSVTECSESEFVALSAKSPISRLIFTLMGSF